MGSQGDNPWKVTTLGENEGFSQGMWSPDGQRLAYIRTQQRGPVREQASIETCDLKGASRTVVVSDRGLEGFWWLPDGRIVYSRQESPGSGDYNLWQIGVDTRAGTPTGKPKRITQWAGSYLWGLTASANGKRLTLQKATFQEQIYLGELEAGGTRMSPPQRLTNDETNEMVTAWAADSKVVFFGSDRNGIWGIFKQGVDQHAPEPVVAGRQGSTSNWARLSADGAWILYVQIPETVSAPIRLMRIPVSGGVPQLVMEMPKGWNHDCARAPASLCVVLEESQDERHLLISAFDPLKGRGKVLRTIEKDPSARVSDQASGLSPDGSTFAISRTGEHDIHIRLLSLSGGSDRDMTVKGWPNLSYMGLAWSTDGKGLYCGSVSNQAGTLLYADLKGNARVLWQYKGWGGYTWGIPSPDGRYLAIQGSATNSNVWMLEGF
jgi:Tol biopolymer transport system component